MRSVVREAGSFQRQRRGLVPVCLLVELVFVSLAGKRCEGASRVNTIDADGHETLDHVLQAATSRFLQTFKASEKTKPRCVLGVMSLGFTLLHFDFLSFQLPISQVLAPTERAPHTMKVETLQSPMPVALSYVEVG